MDLIKQKETLTHEIFKTFTQVYTEVDTIVPDIKPDIARILQADANAYITSRTISGDKLVFEGQAAITLLYQAENGSVRSIITHHPFKHSIVAPTNSENALIDSELCVQNVESVLVNSRKFCGKILMGLEVRLIAAEELEFTTEIEGENAHHFQTNTKKISANYRRTVAEQDLFVRDVLEVPAGKSSIGEVLRMDVTINAHENKVAGNKVLVKGDVHVHTLYLAERDDSVHSMEHQIPFSEIVSINEEASDSHECAINYHVLSTAWNLQQDADGDQRLLGADINLRAILRMEQNISLDVLDDVYSTRNDLEVTHNTVSLSRAIAKASGNVTANDLVPHSDDFADISEIYNVIARPKIASAKIEGSKIVLEGIVANEILCLSANPETPVFNLYKETKFVQTFETGNASLTESMACDVKATLAHTSYSLNMAGEVELRSIVDIETQILTNHDYKYVTEITEKEDKENTSEAKPYCLRVYYVKNGDTVWSIAKKYKIKVDDFVARNGEELSVGQRLILQG
ncbi:spore coat protein [Clostridia bacterium]|nr:spore coat protein [Clostridia bacterium]